MRRKAWCISKRFTKEAIQLLNDNDIDIDIRDFDYAPSEAKLIELLHEYDILIIGCKQHFSVDMLSDIRTNKYVITLSVGMDHIDKECFENEYVKFYNCRHSDVNSVAEYILGLMLSLSKRFKDTDYIMKEHEGDKKFLSGYTFELSNKTVGLIGAGNITQRLIELLQPFHTKLLCYTKHPQSHMNLTKYVEYVDLDYLLINSDIINISIPLTDETNNLIDANKMELLKEDAIIINTAREKIVEKRALIDFVNNHKNFMYAMDIDIPEDKEEWMILNENKNIIITPHLAGSANEARDRMYIECANNIIEWCNENL